MLAMRAAYAHDDPWIALQHADENQAIYAVIGGERILLDAHLYRGLNLRVPRGVRAGRARASSEIAAGDAILGPGRLAAAVQPWPGCARTTGALDEARELARSAARARARASQVALEEGRGRWALAEVLRRRGDLAGAERERAWPRSRMARPRSSSPAPSTLAAIRLAQGRAADALAAAEDAAAARRAMGGCRPVPRPVHPPRSTPRRSTPPALFTPPPTRPSPPPGLTYFAIADRIPDPAYRQSFLEAHPRAPPHRSPSPARGSTLRAPPA